MNHSSSMSAGFMELVVVAGACLAALGTVGRSRGRVDRCRWPAIALLFLASMVHVPLISAHLEEAPYLGVLFIAFAVSTFGLAALLAARPAPVLYPAATLLCGAAIVAYVATRLVAFPLLADDVGDWTEPLGLVSVAAESGVVLVGVRARAARPIAEHPQVEHRGG